MEFDINQIIKILPHSYPLLLVDRVLECNPGQSVVALKNVTYNEPFFTGHFPKAPVMPGVLIVEAMAQACAICSLVVLPEEDRKDSLVYFMSIDGAKFRKPVIPGDIIMLKAHVINQRSNTCKFSCLAFVGDNKVAEAVIMAMVVRAPG